MFNVHVADLVKAVSSQRAWVIICLIVLATIVVYMIANEAPNDALPGKLHGLFGMWSLVPLGALSTLIVLAADKVLNKLIQTWRTANDLVDREDYLRMLSDNEKSILRHMIRTKNHKIDACPALEDEIFAEAARSMINDGFGFKTDYGFGLNPSQYELIRAKPFLLGSNEPPRLSYPKNRPPRDDGN